MSPGDEPSIEADALLARLREATLGEFEILGEAGRGGMAVVYLAHDLALDRKVAIKVIAPDVLWQGEGIGERFQREAKVSASLSHPHIIPIYAVKETDELVFFVMKFVEGRTLESVIAEVGALPVPMVHTILTQVGSALGYAHRHGVVHRDIKPANIMLDGEGWAVVTDFGIAKVSAAEGLTQTGSAVGTPAYMSPEQCAGQDVTGASDQYTLGIVAYEMLTGEKPFEAPGAMALMYKQLHAEPEPLEAKVPDCPPPLCDAVMRMLAKAPEDRWPSFEDLVSFLGAVPPAESDHVRTHMLELVQSSSARAIVERFQTPRSPVPASRASGLRTPGDAARTPAGTGAAAGSAPRGEGSAARSAAAPGAGFSRWSRRLGLATAPAVLVVALFVWGPWRGGDASDTASDPVPGADPPPAGETAPIGQPLPDGSAEEDDAAPVADADAGAEADAAPVADPEPIADPERGPPADAVASVSIAPASGTLTVGETLALSATPRTAEGATLAARPVSWSSNDESVARVSPTGVVSAVAPGVARITASSGGRQQAAVVTVLAVEAASVDVTPTSQTLRVGGAVRLAATVRDAGGRALTQAAPRWTSSDDAVARVSAAGEVTAVAPGSATITAASGSASGAAEIVVEAAPVESPSDPRPAVEALVAAYARALQEQDLAEARRLYPEMTGAEESRWARFFADVRDLGVTMSAGELSTEGSLLAADVVMTLRFRDTRQQEQRSVVRMTFREDGGVWRIVAVR